MNMFIPYRLMKNSSQNLIFKFINSIWEEHMKMKGVSFIPNKIWATLIKVHLSNRENQQGVYILIICTPSYSP